MLMRLDMQLLLPGSITRALHHCRVWLLGQARRCRRSSTCDAVWHRLAASACSQQNRSDTESSSAVVTEPPAHSTVTWWPMLDHRGGMLRVQKRRAGRLCVDRS
jgi:hypothetical protein